MPFHENEFFNLIIHNNILKTIFWVIHFYERFYFSRVYNVLNRSVAPSFWQIVTRCFRHAQIFNRHAL